MEPRLNIEETPAFGRLLDLASTLDVRPYDMLTDYKTLQQWWAAHNESFLDPDILSSLGIVVEDDSGPLMMGWLYVTNSAISHLSWVVSRPQLGPKKRFVSLVRMVDAAEEIATRSGYKIMQIASDQPGLTKMAKMSGFRMLRHHEFLFKYIIGGDDADA